MKLVIDRSKWCRGESGARLLRKEDGKMCCLGFLALACQLTHGEISGLSEPCEVVSPLWPAWLSVPYEDEDGVPFRRMRDKEACGALIDANDSRSLSEEERERAIAYIMGEHGVEVEFMGGELP